MTTRITIYVVVLAGLFFLRTDPGARGEYYQYMDKDGVLNVVEDPNSIPPEYRLTKNPNRENEDNLTDTKQPEQRSEPRPQSMRLDRNARDAAIHRRQARLETPVRITGNQVFVTVSLSSGGSKTEADLLLDTGASTTLITPKVAERLRIANGKPTFIRGGGGMVKAKVTTLSAVTVGPVSRKNMRIAIAEEQGDGHYGEGLLGMDFLRGYTYHIDFAAQKIIWNPRSR